MWPFSKKIRKLEPPIDDEQRWSVALGRTREGPVLVRFNETAGEWVAHPDLPIKLGFAVPLNRPNEGAAGSSRERRAAGDRRRHCAAGVFDGGWGARIDADDRRDEGVGLLCCARCGHR